MRTEGAVSETGSVAGAGAAILRPAERTRRKVLEVTILLVYS